MDFVSGSFECVTCRRKRRVGFDYLVLIFFIEHRCVKDAFQVLLVKFLDRRLQYVCRSQRDEVLAFRVHDTCRAGRSINFVFKQMFDCIFVERRCEYADNLSVKYDGCVKEDEGHFVIRGHYNVNPAVALHAVIKI